MSELTCAQECQIVAKTLSEFTSAIPKQVLSLAMGIAVCNGSTGVALVRLPSQEWSAPCAILLQSTTSISPGQATVLLFMTEQCLYSLVGRTGMILGKTHSFMPGPMYSGSVNAEVLAYVRYNGGFTPEQLIRDHMTGWCVQEDTDRHTLWHQNDATWFDVLTNAISVNRSSVGNAVYLILNMSSEKASRTNYADIEKWAAEQRMKQQQKSLMGTDAHRENLQGSVIHSSLPRRHVADDLFGGETHRSLPRYLNTDYQMSASNGNAPIPAQQYQSYQQQQPVFPPSHFVGQQQTGSASQVNAQQVYLLQQQQLQMQQQFQMMNQMQQQQQQQQQQQYTQQQQNSGQQGQVQNPYQQSGGWNT